jgi:ArsR family transcriptional regulator
LKEQAQMDSNMILDILGNDTRRRILATLSQEPMYFNQLAKEIDIGQQAVLRHLQALEECGLIETYAEKSKLGAPDRKYYRLNTSFMLTISASEDDFTITNQKIVESRHKESMKYYKMLDSMPTDAGLVLSSLQENLTDIEEEISSLESRLNDLRALKQLILYRLHEIGKEVFDEDERKILYKIIEESPRSVAELSNMVGEKQSHLRAIITGMKSKMDRGSAKALLDLQ